MEITKEDIGKSFVIICDDNSPWRSIIKEVKSKTIVTTYGHRIFKNKIIWVGDNSAEIIKKIEELRSQKAKIADAWFKEEVMKLGENHGK